MNTTVNAVCYKSKTLKNGEHPIMLRICKQGKMKYLSLGISINPQFWDFKKNQPKPSCPDRELIQKIILDKKAEYQIQILELKASNKTFTASSLIESTEKTLSTKTKKRSITKEDIKKIISLNLSNESEFMQFSRDIFIFSYLQSGINFTEKPIN